MNVFNIICGPNRIYSRVDSNESEMETRETRSHVRLSATECVRVCVSVCAWTLASVHVRVCVCLQYYKFSPFLLFLFFFFCNSYIPFVDVIRYKSTWHIFFQLLDTLPVCQDFNRQVCNRPACKFIHLSDGELLVRYRWEHEQVDRAQVERKVVCFVTFTESIFIVTLLLSSSIKQKTIRQKKRHCR